MIYGRELEGYPYNLKAIATRCIIKGQRILFGHMLKGISDHAPMRLDYIGRQASNDAIRNLLEDSEPRLIARFGSGEMEAILRGLDVTAPEGMVTKFLKMCCGKSGPYWWENSIRAGLVWIAGYFPEKDSDLEKFAFRAAEDSRQIDLLGSWLAGEKRMAKRYFPEAKAVYLDDLEPFWCERPWTTALKGKRVLLVNPFADTARKQYARRSELFANPEVLPDYELIPYESVQSCVGNKTPYKTWFEALDKMTEDISHIDFDVAIIGAGAYGMSIGAFVKRELKRKALHLGGMTQLLYGIKGKRWDDRPKYVKELYNDAWVRPSDAERPKNYLQHECGAYW